MTAVLDASALVKYLTRQVAEADTSHFDDTLVAPDILLAEVGNGLRRAAHRGIIEENLALLLLHKLLEMPISMCPSRGLLERAFELRHNLTVNDACYVALAEQRACRLVTADARLARAPGVEVPCTLV